jgi:hypothetical protein
VNLNLSHFLIMQIITGMEPDWRCLNDFVIEESAGMGKQKWSFKNN